MPHSDEKIYTDEDYEECIDHLTAMINGCKDDVIPFIGTDLNARIGTRNQHDESAASFIGPHSLPEKQPRETSIEPTSCPKCTKSMLDFLSKKIIPHLDKQNKERSPRS